MNIELARGEQALVRLRRIERPTPNEKQTSNTEHLTAISVYSSFPLNLPQSIQRKINLTLMEECTPKSFKDIKLLLEPHIFIDQHDFGSSLG